ncbi:hypothetical protein PAXINDRAFT_62320, partial [Paxillus involutus ATCC 200175]
FLSNNNKRPAFHMGFNSSCHQCICDHYKLCKKGCAERKLHEHHHAIPQEI